MTDKTTTLEQRLEKAERERDFLVEEYERAFGCGKQGYIHAAMHIFNAITNARIDAKLSQAAERGEAMEKARPVALTVLDYFRRELHDVFIDCGDEVSESSIINALDRVLSIIPVTERMMVPGGWKLVPVDPTPDMIIAGIRANLEHAGKGVFGSIYKAMLSATPSPTIGDAK